MSLSDLNLSDLRGLARAHGVAVSGTKDTLVSRLEDAGVQPPEPAPLPEVEERTATPEGPASDAARCDHEETPCACDAPVSWVAGPGSPGAPQSGTYYDLALPAVRPEFVDQAWMDKQARVVLRRALADGLVPCSDVEHIDTTHNGKMFVFRVLVRG